MWLASLTDDIMHAAAMLPALRAAPHLATQLAPPVAPFLALRGGAGARQMQTFAVDVTLYLGTIMSALSGCITAGAKRMDLLGCIVVGCITAMGGGTLRDVMLGRPPFWLTYSGHLHLSFWSSVVVFLVWPFIVSSGFKDTHLAFLWSDAIGMAASTVFGAIIGLQETGQWPVAIICGVVTATFGGIGRDLLCLEPPRALYAERSMYATPALLGASCYVLLERIVDHSRVPESTVAGIAFFLALFMRAAAWTYRLALPRWARKHSSFGVISGLFGGDHDEGYKIELAPAKKGEAQPRGELS